MNYLKANNLNNNIVKNSNSIPSSTVNPRPNSQPKKETQTSKILNDNNYLSQNRVMKNYKHCIEEEKILRKKINGERKEDSLNNMNMNNSTKRNQSSEAGYVQNNLNISLMAYDSKPKYYNNCNNYSSGNHTINNSNTNASNTPQSQSHLTNSHESYLNRTQKSNSYYKKTLKSNTNINNTSFGYNPIKDYKHNSPLLNSQVLQTEPDNRKIILSN